MQLSELNQCMGDTRSPVLEESLQKFGVEKFSKDDVQKTQWEVLEAKIGNWIHFMRIACFAEVTGGSVAVLLSFGDAIAKSKRSPEKLFVLLDMYEIMRALHAEIEALFRGKSCSEIREFDLGLTKKLAQTAQETFGDFEEAVEKDATKTAVADGTVHPLTIHVINYVKFLFEFSSQLGSSWSSYQERRFQELHMCICFSQSTLKQLFQEFESRDGSHSQLAAVTMVGSVRDLLGDDWVQRHRRIVQQHANQYKRIAWAKILQYLFKA